MFVGAAWSVAKIAATIVGEAVAFVIANTPTPTLCVVSWLFLALAKTRNAWHLKSFPGTIEATIVPALDVSHLANDPHNF